MTQGLGGRDGEGDADSDGIGAGVSNDNGFGGDGGNFGGTGLENGASLSLGGDNFDGSDTFGADDAGFGSIGGSSNDSLGGDLLGDNYSEPSLLDQFTGYVGNIVSAENLLEGVFGVAGGLIGGGILGPNGARLGVAGGRALAGRLSDRTEARESQGLEGLANQDTSFNGSTGFNGDGGRERGGLTLSNSSPEVATPQQFEGVPWIGGAPIQTGGGVPYIQRSGLGLGALNGDPQFLLNSPQGQVSLGLSNLINKGGSSI